MSSRAALSTTVCEKLGNAFKKTINRGVQAFKLKGECKSIRKRLDFGVGYLRLVLLFDELVETEF
jgi:hypothetical protein